MKTLNVACIQMPPEAYSNGIGTSFKGEYVSIVEDTEGRNFMKELAGKVFKEYPIWAAGKGEWPLKLDAVQILEHGGWWLIYQKVKDELRITYSANDAAIFPVEINDIRSKQMSTKWNWINLGEARIGLDLPSI